MNKNANKLILISGCSGGGKSTLLDELSRLGYLVVPEVGREIVKDQLEKGGDITPWQNPILFCERLIEQSVLAYQNTAKSAPPNNQLIFFDRSFLDAVSYYESLNMADRFKYNSLIEDLRFYPIILMTPPWKEIYSQDSERQHSFEDAVNEYERLMKFYPRCGYQIIELPKVTVDERLKFILSQFS